MDSVDVVNCCKCPITKFVFKDPVTAEDGFSYEREAIEQWLRENQMCMSPMTGMAMGGIVTTNFVVRQLVQGLLDKGLIQPDDVYTPGLGLKKVMEILRNDPERLESTISSFDKDEEMSAWAHEIDSCTEEQLITLARLLPDKHLDNFSVTVLRSFNMTDAIYDVIHERNPMASYTLFINAIFIDDQDEMRDLMLHIIDRGIPDINSLCRGKTLLSRIFDYDDRDPIVVNRMLLAGASPFKGSKPPYYAIISSMPIEVVDTVFTLHPIAKETCIHPITPTIIRKLNDQRLQHHFD